VSEVKRVEAMKVLSLVENYVPMNRALALKLLDEQITHVSGIKNKNAR